MKFFTLAVSGLCVLAAVSTVNGEGTCMYKADGLGVTYDISQLALPGQNYHIYGGDLPCTAALEENYTYTYNFCSPVSHLKTVAAKCADKRDASVVQLNLNGECKVTGRFSTQEFALVDPAHPAAGVKITYSGGDQCHTNNVQRKTFIYAMCSHDGQLFSEDAVDEPGGAKSCEYEIKIHSNKACPLECPMGARGKPCGGNGHCAYDHTNNKARCFCNTGKGGAGCTEDIVEQNAISGTMTGLLVTVIILVVGLGSVLGFLIWKVREARGNTSTYMKVEGTEMMLNSQI
jgi:hypothetical protein